MFINLNPILQFCKVGFLFCNVGEMVQILQSYYNLTINREHPTIHKFKLYK